MPDIGLRVTKEFYWFLEWYKNQRGLNSRAAALAELAQIGLDTLKPHIKEIDDMQISPGGWGGYRHGSERTTGGLYMTKNEPPNPLDIDITYADELDPTQSSLPEAGTNED